MENIENNFITISKSTNVILRARKIKSGWSLLLDIHYKGKRKTEYLKMILSSVDKRKYTNSDNEKLRIAKKIQAKRVIEIADGTYGNINIFNEKANLLKYYQMLADEHISNHAKTKYKWTASLKYFKEYIKNNNVQFNHVKRNFLEGYKAFLLGKVSRNSASTYFSILSQVFVKARVDKIIQSNPMSDVRGITQHGSLKTFLTVDELKLLLSTGNVNSSGKVLFPLVSKKAFIFCCFTGLRFSDVRLLTGEQIQIEDSNHYLYFISGKSNKADRIKLHPLAVEQLSNIGGQGKVFPGLASKDVINDHLKLWGKNAGIGKHITFHVSKHTFATMALNVGVDIYTLKELLHHSNIKTTEIYAKLLSKTKEEAIDKLPNL